MVPALAEPDTRQLLQAPKSGRRRLSLCSLPVPKQFEGNLWSLIFLLSRLVLLCYKIDTSVSVILEVQFVG
jgi:hypothetical protein